jgi:hypothetical protein
VFRCLCDVVFLTVVLFLVSGCFKLH